MKPSFEQTVDLLVKAYLNDTLRHGDYCSCAVGNIVASAVGAKIYRTGLDCLKWDHSEYDGSEWYRGDDKSIAITGYSLEEIIRIEGAFESTRDWFYPNKNVFEGLMCVLDVLADIHTVDLTVKESAKLQFVKL